MLDIQTFDARQGGNVLYKALAHPLAAEAIARLYAELAAAGPVAVFDPDDVFGALLALHPAAPRFIGRYVQDVSQIGVGAMPGLPVTMLRESGAAAVLVAAFDAQKTATRLPALAPEGARILTLDAARLPDAMLTNPRRTLDRLNYATNHAFFRDEHGLSTRLVTANYWSGYGAGAGAPLAAAVRRGGRDAGDMGAGGVARSRRPGDRQRRGARPVRPARVHRPAVPARDRRRRARRGQIRARRDRRRQPAQPVGDPRRQRPGRPTATPASPRPTPASGW